MDCRYSSVARPLSYGYWKHHPDDIKDRRVRSRVKRTLIETADMFHIIGNVLISHESKRKHIPKMQKEILDSSGYFVYDGQYVHISGKER